MADEKIEAVTSETAPRPAVQPAVQLSAQPGLVSYVVKHRLIHDDVEYAPGDAFQHPDEKVIKTLRAAHAIQLETEAQAADDVAAKMAALEAQLAAMRAENERLQAQREQGVVQTTATGGKSK